MNISIHKIFKFNQRFSKFVNLEDSFFLNDNENIFLENNQNKINQYDCIQLFTNEVAYLYLWRIKSCSKYYMVWSIGSEKLQKRLINDLKESDLIFTTKYDNLGHPIYKLSLVNLYIKNNYVNYTTQFNKMILQKK